jgi:hypothetical protein
VCDLASQARKKSAFFSEGREEDTVARTKESARSGVILTGKISISATLVAGIGQAALTNAL